MLLTTTVSVKFAMFMEVIICLSFPIILLVPGFDHRYI